MEFKNPVMFMKGDYDTNKYYELIKGHEGDKEGNERCFLCYRLRLEEAASVAKEGGYEFFTTTLTISPHKDAVKLNEIGEELATSYGVLFLPSDFKKRNGYKRSLNYPIDTDYTVRIIRCVFPENRDNITNKSSGIIPKWPQPFRLFY